MIKVAIVEDDARVRASLAQLIDEAPGFSCVCHCNTAEDALERIPAAAPDVVLMDIHLPNLSGIECASRLRRALPALRILMLTVYEDNEVIFKALQAGASGYLLKRTPPGGVAPGYCRSDAGRGADDQRGGASRGGILPPAGASRCR
jgi:DNA-binding NarL/FixJ family response regulator